MITTFFDFASCVVKLECFNCPPTLHYIFITFTNFHYLGVQSLMWKSRSNAYHKIIFLDNMTIITFIEFRFCVSRATYSYLWYPFFLCYLIYLSFHVSSAFILSDQHFETEEKILCRFDVFILITWSINRRDIFG